MEKQEGPGLYLEARVGSAAAGQGAEGQPGAWCVEEGVIKVCTWRRHVARAADVQLAFRGLRGDFLSSSQAGLEETSRFCCTRTGCCSCYRAQKSEGILGYAQGDQ